jgi:glucan phosphoethanolaminetransferase (alkaline phosphatase superfamily)
MLYIFLSFLDSVETRKNILQTINTKHKVNYYANILGCNTTVVRASNTGAYNLGDGFKEVFSDSNKEGALNYKILPLFFNSIQEGEKQFIFGYVRGAHYLYNENTEARFEKFQNGLEGSENAYNNKLVEMDHTWLSIIKKLKNYTDPTFLIFTSDHGESLG